MRGEYTSCPSVVFLAWDRVNLACRICNEPLLFVTDIPPRPPRCLHLFSRNECRGDGEGREKRSRGEGKREFLEFSETKSIRFKRAEFNRLGLPAFSCADCFQRSKRGCRISAYVPYLPVLLFVSGVVPDISVQTMKL